MKTLIINNISHKVFSGGTPSTQNKNFWNGTIPWLSSGETRNNFITKTEKHITELGVKKSSTKLSIPGDILIASAGQGFTRGQVSYNKINTYINQSIIAIRINKTIANPLYVFYNLSNRYLELRNISDSNSIRGSITTDLIKNLEIILPDIITQDHIVDTITHLLMILLIFL